MFKRVVSFTLTLPFLLSLSMTGCGPLPEEMEEEEETASEALSHDDILARWAPIHYQDVTWSTRFGGNADLLARVNYDGDWVARNNWDNITSDKASFEAVVYGKLIDSKDYYYLYFMFYHPLDWALEGQKTDDEHEHDAESVYMIVRKDKTPYGKLLGIITEFHGGKMTAIAGPLVAKKGPSVQVEWETLPGETFPRVRTYQESGGHGIYPCGYGADAAITRCDRPEEDGYKYVPGVSAEEPGSLGNAWKPVKYAIVDIDELFNKRGHQPVNGQEVRLFADPPWGDTFEGDHSPGCAGQGYTVRCRVNAAHPIWKGTGDPVDLFTSWFWFPASPAPSAAEQNPFACPPGEDEASVFADGEYKGACVTYRIDPFTGRNALHTLGPNPISSIKLGSQVNAIAFQRAEFWPASQRWTESIHWVDHPYDNKIAALLLVRKDRDCDALSTPGYGEILLYETENFGGHCTRFDRNDVEVRDIGKAGFPNDLLSSFKVGPGTSVTFYVNPNFGGQQFVFQSGDHFSPAFANDQVTSFRIR